MSLKTRPLADGESPLCDPWSGLWGSVVPDAKSLSMLRVELPAQNGKQETHAFVYSSLSRWLCRKTGEDEELEIHFGKQLVKVQGRGLGKLIDALDEGRLKILRTCPQQMQLEKPWVAEISLKIVNAASG
ncbi:MAG TPA: hypothetical protein VGZ93_11740 [Candidatus Methylacidiphilales bacterium]|jgi:hypothetical protein|nr:hypothetical protein [Candidatus Methylacidiphilales bacterium]